MSTMKDIAEQCGVSISTVSYALSGTRPIRPALRKEILETATRLGFTARKSIPHRSQASVRTIGLFGLDVEDIDRNAFFYSVFSKLLSMTSSSGIHLQLFPDVIDAKSGHRSFMTVSDTLSGAIIMQPRPDDTLIHQFRLKKTPFIFLGRPSTRADEFSFVDSDNVSIGYNAARLMLENGRQRIFFLNGPVEMTISADRREGVEMARREFRNGQGRLHMVNTQWSVSQAEEKTRAILSNEDIDCIIASSDLQAVGAMNAIFSLGLRIPRDIALVCCSDTYLMANYNPPVTGIDPQPHLIGEAVGSTLMKLIRREFIKPVHLIIPFRLNVRSST